MVGYIWPTKASKMVSTDATSLCENGSNRIGDPAHN